MSWAYEFACERSLAEMAALLDRSGPWRWGIRDCAWHPDYLQSRPAEGARICVYERTPPGGPGYRCLVEVLPGSGPPRTAIDPTLRALLARLPATGLTEVEPGAWPFE